MFLILLPLSFVDKSRCHQLPLTVEHIFFKLAFVVGLNIKEVNSLALFFASIEIPLINQFVLFVISSLSLKQSLEKLPLENKTIILKDGSLSLELTLVKNPNSYFLSSLVNSDSIWQKILNFSIVKTVRPEHQNLGLILSEN